MHLINIRGLKHDLAAGRVTSYEVAIYLFLTASGGFPIWYFADKPEADSFKEMLIGFAFSAASLLVAYFGFRACYYANGGLSGNSFADRFLSIGFVVGLRLSLVLIPVVLAAIWILEIKSEQALAAPILAFDILYFWRVNLHIRDLNAKGERAA